MQIDVSNLKSDWIIIKRVFIFLLQKVFNMKVRKLPNKFCIKQLLQRIQRKVRTLEQPNMRMCEQ